MKIIKEHENKRRIIIKLLKTEAGRLSCHVKILWSVHANQAALIATACCWMIDSTQLRKPLVIRTIAIVTCYKFPNYKIA